MTSVEAVRARYREIHGGHPTSAADDLVLSRTHEPVSDDRVLADMAAGRLPMPPYLLSDGTPVAPSDHLDPVGWAGGADRLHDWFVRYWSLERRADAERAFADWMAGRYGWLTPTTPRTLRRLERAQDQAREAVALLEADPRDPLARGSLDEAVGLLDQLLLPSTDHDRSRLGGTTPREEWVERLRRDHLTRRPTAAPVRTERLVLRQHVPSDIDDLHAFYGREDVAEYLLHGALATRRVRGPLPGAGRRGGEDGFGLVIDHDGRVVGDMVLMFRGPARPSSAGWSTPTSAAAASPPRRRARCSTSASATTASTGSSPTSTPATPPPRGSANGSGMRRESHRLAGLLVQGRVDRHPASTPCSPPSGGRRRGARTRGQH